MNEDLREIIAKEFCGDSENSFYEYKSGPVLVQFFNSNFGYNDIYQSGFPTRWRYVSDKINELNNQKRLNEFISLIMSIEFHIREKNFDTLGAAKYLEKLMDHWNKKLRPFRYQFIKINDQYELTNYDADLQFIGEGGFAEVFLQKSTGHVIKKLKRENLLESGSRHRFKREYEITKNLSDISGIIQVFDFNDSDYFYVMEKCDITLYDFLSKNQLNIDSKEQIIDRIIKIISEVHDKNIIHRDLSANNIFLKGNEIKIADFGVGKDFNLIFSHKTTNTNQIGQIQYSPPEQLMRLADTGKYSDVFSLGRLINFILTKKPNDTNHKYKILVEKATSLDIESRHIDGGDLYESFHKVKKFVEDEDNKKIIMTKILKGIYDEDISMYIYSLNSEELCNNLVHTPGFTNVLQQHISNNPESILEILNYIETDMHNSIKEFHHADNFADIGYYILINDLSTYDVKEKAAYILNDVAFSANRFYAQDLIEVLIEKGIEPLIEEILSK